MRPLGVSKSYLLVAHGCSVSVLGNTYKPCIRRPFFFPYETSSKVFTKHSNMRVMFGFYLLSSLKKKVEVCYVEYAVNVKGKLHLPRMRAY
jgi:hypothetical protein